MELDRDIGQYIIEPALYVLQVHDAMEKEPDTNWTIKVKYLTLLCCVYPRMRLAWHSALPLLVKGRAK